MVVIQMDHAKKKHNQDISMYVGFMDGETKCLWSLYNWVSVSDELYSSLY